MVLGVNDSYNEPMTPSQDDSSRMITDAAPFELQAAFLNTEDAEILRLIVLTPVEWRDKYSRGDLLLSVTQVP